MSSCDPPTSVRSFSLFRMTAHNTTVMRPSHVSLRKSQRTMDPARPNEPDPADPFNPERADHAVLETIEIATEGEDCDDCVSKMRPVLMKINGVRDVAVDLPRERV